MRSLVDTWQVIRAAIKADNERRKAHLGSEEASYLPAALEVIEQPVSPTARITAWTLLALIVVTLAWLIIGRVDVVASAPGKIMPAGSVKTVQASAMGMVRAIHVQDGDHVRKGQLLIELDTTMANAELQQSSKGLLNSQLEIARNRAIADALSGRGMHFNPPAGVDPALAETQRRLVAAQVGELEATTAGLEAARHSALSEAAAAAATRARLDDTIPILDHELEAMNRLDAKGYAPGLRLLEMQRQRRNEQGERSVAMAQEQRGQFDASKLGDQINQTREQARRQALTDLAKAENEVLLRHEDVTKAQRRSTLQNLYATEDGTVQQLALHTIGGVVEAARTLMVIVPTAHEIEVEARVLNKDAGFVHEGQTVAVKIEAFPFTRYGTVPGHVVSISRDAVSDQKLGAVYVARIRLDHTSIVVDGQPIVLSSGLGVISDIRTGSRRIISWLLSPVQTSVSQAARER